VFQIFDYAQYYLDLADANRKLSAAASDVLNQGQSAPIHVSTGAEEALLAASSLTSAGAGQTFARPPTQPGLWRIEYNFTSLYEMDNINPASMGGLSSKLAANQTWFDAYFRTNMVNYEGPWLCNAMCRHVQTCAISHVDYSDYAYCVDQAVALGLDTGLGGLAGISGATVIGRSSHGVFWESFIVTSFLTAIISARPLLLR
jgi:hypothetical protein